MNIIKRVFEEVTIESYLPSEIISEAEKLIDKGYNFTPVKNYTDSKNQRVYYSIGRKFIK